MQLTSSWVKEHISGSDGSFNKKYSLLASYFSIFSVCINPRTIIVIYRICELSFFCYNKHVDLITENVTTCHGSMGSLLNIEDLSTMCLCLFVLS